MAAGLFLGAGFVSMVGFKAYRNFFSDENDVKHPMAHEKRMNGVADRLMANPRLLEQYNEKYIDKKFETNSVLRRHDTRKKIERSRSQEIQRRASSRAEKDNCPTYLVDSPAAGA